LGAPFLFFLRLEGSDPRGFPVGEFPFLTFEVAQFRQGIVTRFRGCGGVAFALFCEAAAFGEGRFAIALETLGVGRESLGFSRGFGTARFGGLFLRANFGECALGRLGFLLKFERGQSARLRLCFRLALRLFRAIRLCRRTTFGEFAFN